LRDNTELHAVLRDLDGAQDLADGLRAQAHEFANKLHVISGLLELGHTDEVVAFIERAGNGGTLTSVTGSTGIKDLEVAALILVKQTRARELGTTTVVDPASTLDGPAIATLRNDLLTVIGNLLDNAIEACTSDGRVTLSIMMDSQGPERENVVVVVTDNGPGIAPELRQRVFEPGFSSKSASPTTFSTGRGIGLALVKRVVERHGGTVRVEDAADRGTRFTVRLPLATGQGTPLKDQPVTTAKL
jgi:two-component system CitB family sensor kinase